jgi:hypothetical protein
VKVDEPVLAPRQVEGADPARVQRPMGGVGYIRQEVRWRRKPAMIANDSCHANYRDRSEE